MVIIKMNIPMLKDIYIIKSESMKYIVASFDKITQNKSDK